MEDMYLILLLEVVTILLVLLPAYIGYRKGFLYACLGFLPVVVSFLGAKLLSPICSKFLREVGLFSLLQESIVESTVLKQLMGGQTDGIGSMEVPSFLKTALLENNNPVVHSLFQTEELKAYIAGYFANVCLNVISVTVVAVALYIGTKLFLRALHIVAQLPILNMVNRSCGFLVGGIKGICFVWFLGILVTFFYTWEKFQGFFAVLESSYVANFLYQHNVLLALVLKIFA